jgi:DNA-binding HxlR family transcriptional regulator
MVRLDAFGVLALKGTRKILEMLKARERMRYSELVDAIGFSTTTSRALKAMEAAKLVDRKVLDEPYRPVAYSLTEKGKKLSQLVAEIEKL